MLAATRGYKPECSEPSGKHGGFLLVGLSDRFLQRFALPKAWQQALCNCLSNLEHNSRHAVRPGRFGRAAKLPGCEVLFQKALLRGPPAAAQSSEGPAGCSCPPHRPGPAEMWRLEACRELPSSTAQPGSRDLEQQHWEPKLRRWLVPWPEGTSPACHTRAMEWQKGG